MTIAEAREKCKSFAARIPRDALVIAILVLASSFSFGLGYLAGQDAERGSDITLEKSPLTNSSSSGQAIGQVVASKNGTTYYSLGCAGADRISDANKVWFTSPAAAAAAGYTPAAHCKGM